MNNSVESDSVALSKGDWMQVRQDLVEICPIITKTLEYVTERHPDAATMLEALDPDIFEADIQAASAAIAYVAEFAADKCRFVLVCEEDDDAERK